MLMFEAKLAPEDSWVSSLRLEYRVYANRAPFQRDIMFSPPTKLDFYGCLKSHYQDPLVGVERAPERESASVHHLHELRCPKILPLRFFPERPGSPIPQYT